MRQFRVWVDIEEKIGRTGQIIFPESDHVWFKTIKEAKVSAVKLRLQGWKVAGIQEYRRSISNPFVWEPGQPEKKRKKKCVVKAG